MTRKYKIFFSSLFLYILVLVLITLPGVEFYVLDVISSVLTRLNAMTVTPCHIPEPKYCDFALVPSMTVLPHVFMVFALLGFSFLSDRLISFFSDKDYFGQTSNAVILSVLIVCIAFISISNLNLINYFSLNILGNTFVITETGIMIGLLSLIGLGDPLISLYTKIRPTRSLLQ